MIYTILLVLFVIGVSAYIYTTFRTTKRKEEKKAEPPKEESEETDNPNKMTANQKLVYADLCGRLPFGVKCAVYFKNPRKDGFNGYITELNTYLLEELEDLESTEVKEIKPILRRLVDMTEEEQANLRKVAHEKDEKLYLEAINKSKMGDGSMRGKVITHFAADWCNAHHFDYRGLIDKGLANMVDEKYNPYK